MISRLTKKNFIVTQDNENFTNRISNSVKSGEKFIIVLISTAKSDSFQKRNFQKKEC
jgi:hypothetical protein